MFRQVHLLITLSFLIAFPVITNAQGHAETIQINQVGYYPDAPKIVVITEPSPGNDFYIIRTGSKDTAYRGVLSGTIQSAWSSTKTRIADFSSLKKEGSYLLILPAVATSRLFEIRKNIFHVVSAAVIKGFYF